MKKLRTKELTTHVEGKIKNVANSKYGSYKVYYYFFEAHNQIYQDSYQMDEVKGIKKGSPVGVIYLTSNPDWSRLVFIKDDFQWIKK